MDIHNLVHMANRIGDFYESMPDAEEAKSDIANHIAKFWEPRMRRILIEQLQTEGTQALHAMVREAVVAHRAELMPKA
jgi:formate dehydrogenase subunit delta